MAIAKIEGLDVLEIGQIASGLPYGDNTKMKGSTYGTFTYEGKVFVANDSSGFAEAVKAGTLHSVKLDTNEDGNLSLAGFVTKTQVLGAKVLDKKIEMVDTAKWADLAADPKFVAA